MTVHYTRPRYYIHKRISEYFRYKHMQTSDRCTYTRCHQPQIQEFVMGGGGGGGEGECSPLAAIYQNWGGGAVGKLNEPIRHSHAFSTKTQGTSRQTGPFRTCPVVLHRFVDICPYN